MKVKNSDVNLLNICISQILATSEKLSGSVIFNFNRNAGLLKPLLENIDDTRKKIIDQHVEKDDKGEILYKEQDSEDAESVKEYLFTKENEELANIEIQELFKEEVDIKLIKLPLSKFETLSLDTSKIPGLNVFIDHIIDEDN